MMTGEKSTCWEGINDRDDQPVGNGKKVYDTVTGTIVLMEA
jgi:hypothetical protein